MLEKVRAAYTNYRSLKLAACIGLIVCAALLYWLPGGFPPWPWRFLFQVLPTIAHLWQVQGFVILLPLMGLICLSVMLLLLWGMLVVALIKMVQYWWYTFRERQHFLLELREAELLAEQMVADERRRVAVAAVTSSQDGYSASHTEREGRTSTRATSLSPGTFQPVEAQTRPGLATSPETAAIQRIQRLAQTVPAVAAVSLHSSPALARGQLRLVPRPDSAPIRAGNGAAASSESPPGSPTFGQPAHKEEEDERDSDTLDEVPEIEASQQREPSGLEVGVGLHPGFQRKDASNEDALFEIRGTHTTWSGLQQVGLFVVADGMRNSGLGQTESISAKPLALPLMQPSNETACLPPVSSTARSRLDCVSAEMEGKEASRLAIQALSAVMVPALLSNAKVIFDDLLQEGVYSANLAVYSRNREMAEKNCKMGTTMTVALVVGPTAYVANVGNSRTYLYRRNQGLSQITRDHSSTAGLLREGVITSEDIYTHPRRKVLERYLGRQASVEVDSFAVHLRSDDILLLCSDGLWEMVRDAEIEKIICSSGPHPVQISTMLVQTALNHGGADNVSVIVVLYRRDEGA